MKYPFIYFNYYYIILIYNYFYDCKGHNHPIIIENGSCIVIESKDIEQLYKNIYEKT